MSKPVKPGKPGRPDKHSVTGVVRRVLDAVDAAVTAGKELQQAVAELDRVAKITLHDEGEDEGEDKGEDKDSIDAGTELP